MDHSDYSKLKKYTMPTGGFFLTGLGGIMLAVIIAAFLGGYASPLAAAILLFCCAVFLFVGIFDFIAFERLLKRIRQKGDLPTLLADMNGGKKAFGGALILGEMWAIGHHTGYMEKYSDIESAYETVITNKGSEASRALTVKSKNDKAPRVLCNLKGGGKSSEELAEVLAFMSSKNREMKFRAEDAIRIAKQRENDRY